MTTGVVVFDAAAFKEANPEFATYSDSALETFFQRACLILDNSPKSLVKDVNERKTLLELLVCHLATLKKNGSAGILSGATEGSVSVSYTPLSNANWYQLTPCGAAYWAATAKYRQGVRWMPG